MTINSWLQNAIKKLDFASVPTARLDAEVLVADLLHKDRSWLHANPDFILRKSDLRKLDEQISKRAGHEPLAYIRGKQEFYGRDFLVSPDTLTPRPETETMIDLLLNIMKNEKLTTHHSPLTVLDVGTGSGCIAVTAALELSKLSNISYIGLDISEPALEIAKKNAKILGTTVKFKKFDLISDDFTLQPLPYTIILANLPYVPNNFHINLAASHEPGFAIFGGKDGLDYYRILFKKVTDETKVVLTESLPPQHLELIKIANNYGFKLLDSQDLIHVFKR